MTNTIKQNDIVELPNGSVAQVQCIIGDTARLYYIGTHIYFEQKLSEIHYLGEPKNLPDPLIDLKRLIQERNDHAIEVMTKIISKKRTKREPALLSLLAKATDDGEFRAILLEKGLLNLEKGGETNEEIDSDS